MPGSVRCSSALCCFFACFEFFGGNVIVTYFRDIFIVFPHLNVSKFVCTGDMSPFFKGILKFLCVNISMPAYGVVLVLLLFVYLHIKNTSEPNTFILLILSNYSYIVVYLNCNCFTHFLIHMSSFFLLVLLETALSKD